MICCRRVSAVNLFATCKVTSQHVLYVLSDTAFGCQMPAALRCCCTVVANMFASVSSFGLELLSISSILIWLRAAVNKQL